MNESWYPVRVRPRSEYSAYDAMRREGLDVYLPLVKIPRPRRGRWDEPLFPGYLFVRHDWSRPEHHSPSRFPGVVDWVRFDGTIPGIRDDEMDELVRRVDSINATGGVWRRYRAGETVMVATGGLSTPGRVVEEPTSPESRVKLLLTFLGRQVPVKVPWSDLSPLGGSEIAPRSKRAPRRTRGRGRWVRGYGERAPATA